MKNSISLMVVLLMSLTVTTNAQDATANQLVVPVPGGGFVSFTNQTAWTDLRRAFDLQKLPDLLAKRGYKAADVEAIMHGNWLRFYGEVLPS